MSSRCTTTSRFRLMRIVLACALAAAPIASAAETADATPQISGVVFYRLRSGASVILRGLTIYVVEQSEVLNNPGIVVQLATLKINVQTGEIVGDCHRLDGLNKLIEKSAKYKTTTNIDAKYSFQGLGQGDYYIFAFLEAAGAEGIWDMPVKVRDKAIELNLDNSNISAVCDLSAR